MVEKQKSGKVLMLPVDAIEPSPWQARTAFDDTEIAALAVSILQNGLLQPISVRRVGVRKYQLIAGERRLRACKLAKLEKVPAILADWTDSESAALGLLENIQRSQLDPFDTARGIREVIRLWGCTQAAAARRLGLPPEHCLVLEDSFNGVRAGHAAGAVTVMVPDLTQPTPEIRALCTACCKTLLDVRDLLAAGRL